MNNKTSTNFSLRKLILAALVTGPMAILPAPLWALPSTAATNLTTSAGVTVSTVGGNVLNVNAPDKAVLSWVAFGSGTDTILSTDTINYTLPSAAGSLLNIVSGGVASQIDGQIVSNGNVYVLNPAGIVIGNTAVINVGGFYASAIDEPLAAAFFASSGTLSYGGSSGGNVSLAAQGANGALTVRPQIQAVGSGNNIVLAGGTSTVAATPAVSIGSGLLYGNLTARSIGGQVTLASGGALAVNQVNGVGGNVSITTNGGNAVLSTAGTTQTITATAINAAGQVTGATLGGGLSPIGTGYAPNSQIAITLAAPTILQSTSIANTSATTIGTRATGYLTTDAAGKVTGFVLTDPVTGNTATSSGAGYTAAPGAINADGSSSMPLPSGRTTTIAGNLTINTAGTTANGTVTQSDTNLVTASAATITTGVAGSGVLPGLVNLSNANLSSITLPYAGATTVADTTGGLAVGSSKIETNTGNALTLSAAGGGSISMSSSTARVEVVPTLTNTKPLTSLSAGTGSVTFAGTGALTFRALSTSAASGTATITATGDVALASSTGAAVSFGGKGLSITTTGGAISLGNLTNSSGSATLTATGNVTLGTFVTSGAVKAESRNGTLNAGLSGATTTPTTANASATGSEFKAAGDISLYSLASPGATITSSGGSVNITNGFSGAGTITAASDVNITLQTVPEALGGSQVGNRPNTNSAAAAAATITAVAPERVVNAAGAFVVGRSYQILSAGNTDFTSVGAAANTVGTSFVATGVGAGTGTAIASVSPNSSVGGRVSEANVNNAGASAGLGYEPNSTVAVTFTAPGTSLTTLANGGFNQNGGTGNETAAGYATTNSAGQISGIVVTNPGSGYTATPSVIVANPTNAVVANGALSITATGGSVAINAPVVSTSTSALSITSGQSLAVPAITAPTLNLTSTNGSVVQTGAITASGTSTLSAGTSITLSNVANNFGTVVVKNAASGATIADTNDLVIGNGTDAKGSLTVNAGLGVTGVANGATLTVTPVLSAPLGGFAATSTAGQITSVALRGLQSGYTSNQTNIPVIFSAPPAATGADIVIDNVLGTSGQSSGVGQITQGIWLTGGKLQGIDLPLPIGSGYRPSAVIPVSFSAGLGGGTVPTNWEAVVNSNGQISTIRAASNATPGANLTGTFSVTIPAANSGALPYTPVAPSTATGFATANANGVLSSVTIVDGGFGYFGTYVPVVTAGLAPAGITPATGTVASNAANAVTAVTATAGANYPAAPRVTGGGIPYTVGFLNGAVTSITANATGGVTIGAAATDTIRVAGDLTVTTAGPAGQVTSPTLAGKYSEVTTVANSVRVDGKVTTNTTGANVTIGAQAPLGGAVSYLFGSVNGNVGTGTITAYENTTLNLGNITAATVNATSTGGDIVNSAGGVTATTVVASAGSFFSPGSVSLDNASNAIGTVDVRNATNVAVNNTADTTILTTPGATGRGITGSVTATVSAGRALNFGLNAVTPGDFNTIGFNVSGTSAVNVYESNGVTIQNASSRGTSTATVASAGPIVLGSGISLLSSGASSFTSTGATAAITDSAPGVVIYGPASFTSANGISVTQSGHSFGPVTLAAGGNAATNANISFTEAGTLNLRSVTISNLTADEVGGSVVLTSTSGDIIQSGTAGITLPTLAVGDATLAALPRSLSLNAAGAVTLNSTGTGNAINVPVSINAANASLVNLGTAATSGLTLGDITVRNGTFGASTVAVAGLPIAQAAGSKILVFGDATFATKGIAPVAPATTGTGSITLANSGNNFGGLTLTTVNAGNAAGANIALSESGTARLVDVKAGTGGTLSVTSENGSIVSGPTPSIVAGGGAVLSAPVGINLVDGNTIGGTVKLTSAGSVSLQNGATTTLASGSSVGGSLTVRNTAGNIIDNAAGNLTVTGAILLDAGSGNINISGSGNSFGAVQFRGNLVTIAEDAALNLAGGSVANGNATLTSLSDILTSGVGASVFSGTSVFNGALQLSSGGKITLGNNIFVANGLTFRALGAVDLSGTSLSGNLNGRNPINLGAASYKAPTP